jgi:hypothetical protein
MNMQKILDLMEEYVLPNGSKLNVHIASCNVVIGYNRTAKRSVLYNTCGYKTSQNIYGITNIPGVTRKEESVDNGEMLNLRNHFLDWLRKKGLKDNEFSVILSDDFHFRRIEYKLIVR